MRAVQTSLSIAAAIAVHLLASPSSFAVVVGDVVLNPSDITGLRSFSGTTAGAFLLEFQAVKADTEDRTVAHFPLASVASGFESAVLRIPVAIWDPGPPAGTFGVNSFYGDGVVSPDEWDAGSLLEQLTGIDGVGAVTLTVDVSAPLQAGLAQNEPYLSFVFRGGPAFDRYFLNGGVGLPDSSILISYVPEPASLALMSAAACVLVRHRPRRRRCPGG